MPTWTLTLILAGLSMVGPFAIDTFLPSFPAIGEQFAVGPELVQQALSAYLLAFAAMNLFYGTLSDSFGRRPVILSSLALFTVSSIGAAAATSFDGLLLFRVLQGLSAGGGMVIGQAIVRDRFSGPVAQRLLSHIVMVFGLAPAIAPMLGGFLQVHFGWRASFVFMAGIGLVLMLACLRFLQESLPQKQRTAFHPVNLGRHYLAAVRHPQFLVRALAVGFAFGGLGLYIASAASFVMRILHLPETAFGWLFLPMIGGLVGGSALGARLAMRTQPDAVIRLAFTCMAIATAANLAYNWLFPAVVPWAVLPIMLYTFGLGLAMPAMNLLTLDLFPHMRGLAASLLSFLQMLIFSLVSGVVAPLLFDSAFKLAQGVLGCFLLTVLCWWLGTRRRPQAAASLA